MLRVFAKIVDCEDAGLGLNILVFNSAAGVLEQITTGSGGQDAPFTDMRYDPERRKLLFVVGGKIEEQVTFEIEVKTFDTLMKTENWQRLCYGLRTRSSRTVSWCNSKGIYSE